MRSDKVIELNLEYGRPSTAEALSKMTDSLSALKRQGCKAAILIHGYGSSGTGGSIKAAVRKRLGETSMSGIVKAYAGGEQWLCRKKELLSMCRSLESIERRISGNDGITVVIL